MKLLFYLGHPAHYHTISHLLPKLSEEGYEPILAARDKDVLFELIEGLPYRIYRIPGRKKNSRTQLFFSILSREWRIFRLVLKERPALLIGTDIVITHVGYWTGVPSLMIDEDDSEAVPLLAHLGFRYATKVIAPHSCKIAPYEKKKLAYQGIHELAYLHPDRFQPDPTQVEGLFSHGRDRYVLIRVSALQAHHDVGIKGLDEELLRELIERIRPYASVWISSEKELPEDLEDHQLPLPSHRIHHVLAHASLLIGDSQTMSAEAACLGTPFIRFSDLVGKLGYLDELEQSYGLGYGLSSEEKERLLKKSSMLLQNEKLENEWKERRDRFLEDADDPLDFIHACIREEVEKRRKKEEMGS